jgi:hypothetical protein
MQKQVSMLSIELESSAAAWKDRETALTLRTLELEADVARLTAAVTAETEVPPPPPTLCFFLLLLLLLCVFFLHFFLFLL